MFDSGIYDKVETIGDAYMVVSGAPEKEGNHAERVCDMALDMVEAITDLKDPSTGAFASNSKSIIPNRFFRAASEDPGRRALGRGGGGHRRPQDAALLPVRRQR